MKSTQVSKSGRVKFFAAFACLTALAAGWAQTFPAAAQTVPPLPPSGAALPPAVIVSVDKEEDWAALLASDRTDGPRIALFRPDAALGVGGFATVDGVLEGLPDSVLPAFYLSDASAVPFADYAENAGLYDAYVVSDDPALIRSVKEKTGCLYGVVDYTDGAPPLSVITAEVNACGARTAWLGETDKASVEYLQYRWLNVWASGGPQAALTGANGVVADDPAAALAFSKDLPAGTILRNPMLAGHRGLEKTKLENSVSGMLAAYEAGADAVECDVQVSRDDRLVVMHDETLQRTTNGAGAVADMTWDEIKEYEIDYPKAAGYREKIPLLDDFFTAVKGNGKILIVELKTIDPRSVPLLKEKIEQFDIADQIVLITFFSGQIAPARQLLPGISLGNLNYKPTVEREAVYRDAAAKNVTVNPNYGSLDAQSAAALAVRGFPVYPWTYADGAALGEGYYGGMHGLTTSDVSWASDLIEGIEGGLTLYTDRAVRPSVTARTLGGEKFSAPVELVSAGFEYTETADGVTAEQEGAFTALARLHFAGLGKNFYLYASIPVTAVSQPQPDPVDPDPDPPEPDPPDPDRSETEPPQKSGCGGAAAASVPMAGPGLLLCAAAALRRRRGV